ASPHHHFRCELVGEANARLDVAPIGYVVRALARRGKDFAAQQGTRNRLAGERVGVRKLPPVQWVDRVRIKPVLMVELVGSRQRHVVTQTQVQGQLGGYLPVVFSEPRVLVVLGRG